MPASSGRGTGLYQIFSCPFSDLIFVDTTFLAPQYCCMAKCKKHGIIFKWIFVTLKV